MECQLLQQIRESDPINTAGARVIPSYQPPPRPGCSRRWSHRREVLGRLFLALGMVQLWFTSQQQCGEAAWSCAHIVELVMLSQQPARGMDVVLPQTNAALAGISSFQLIPLQPVDLGSMGSEESSMGTAVSLAWPFWFGCRSSSSSSTFPKGEKRILCLLSSAFQNILRFSLRGLV